MPPFLDKMEGVWDWWGVGRGGERLSAELGVRNPKIADVCDAKHSPDGCAGSLKYDKEKGAGYEARGPNGAQRSARPTFQRN